MSKRQSHACFYILNYNEHVATAKQTLCLIVSLSLSVSLSVSLSLFDLNSGSVRIHVTQQLISLVLAFACVHVQVTRVCARD